MQHYPIKNDKSRFIYMSKVCTVSYELCNVGRGIDAFTEQVWMVGASKGGRESEGNLRWNDT